MHKVLSNIYVKRHAKKDESGGGSSSFERERGELFSGWIGTGKRILDIGCRHGGVSRYVIAGNTITGLDIDAHALTQCPPEMETMQADLNGDWHIGREGMFDVVIASEVIEHLYYPNEVMKKIRAVLKPGGLLVGTVPNAFNVKNRFRLLMAHPEATPLGEPTHINHFYKKSLEKLLKRHFEDVTIGGIVQKRWAWFSALSPGLGSFLLTFRGRKAR